MHTVTRNVSLSLDGKWTAKAVENSFRLIPGVVKYGVMAQLITVEIARSIHGVPVNAV